ncbi:hypothetical protein MTO96_022582 [Rhipicephalus appendiculatus]
MTTRQRCAATAGSGPNLSYNLQPLQQQRTGNSAAPVPSWSNEARLDRKIKKGSSVSLASLAAMATAHNIYALPTCTSFLPDSLRSSGSLVAERQRAFIILCSVVDDDGGVFEPQYNSVHSGYYVNVTHQSSDLLELYVEHVGYEDSSAEEMDAGTLDDNGVAALRSTDTEGRASGRRVDVALVDRYLAVPVPEANCGALSTSCGTACVMLMYLATFVHGAVRVVNSPRHCMHRSH